MDTNVKPVDTEASTRTIKLALLGATVTSFCLLFLWMFTWFQPDQASLSDQYFPSPVSTHTRTPTPTPTITLTATMTRTSTPSPTSTSTFTPTITPVPHVLLLPPEGVPVLEETFDSNVHGWESYYANSTLRVEDGQLLIRSDVMGQPGIALCFDCLEYDQTFYFQAELVPENNTSTKYGLAFCAASREGDYYSFTIDQNYSLYRLSKQTSNSSYVMKATYIRSINKYPQSNILGVYFDDGKIVTYVNNVLVASYTDPNPLDCKWAGVMINNGDIDLSADHVFTYTVKKTP